MSRRKKDSRTTAVLAFFGLFTCIILPVAFIFFEFNNVTVTCERPQPAAAPNCEVTDQRLLGIYNRHVTVEHVTGVGYATGDASTDSSVVLASTVVLATPNEEIPVTKVSSSTGGNWKSELILKMQEYLDSPDVTSFSYKSFNQSIIGWGAVGMIVLLIWSCCVWLIGKLRGKSKGA